MLNMNDRQDVAHAARFIDKATAEGVVLKIAQLTPDFAGHMEVVSYEADD